MMPINTTDHFVFRLALFATVLAFIVVTLGAYTRLKDAGLGCPDWPYCYGYLTVPQKPAELQIAMKQYPHQPLESQKAWTEMTHRYVAGILGLLILILAGRTTLNHFRRNERSPFILPLALLALVIAQAMLGMWTVTLRLLPSIVMLHLLGGFTLLALLMVLVCKLGHYFQQIDPRDSAMFKSWAGVGLIMLVLQILLGGWTSANYAALVCPDFPLCHGAVMSSFDFQQAFHFFGEIGPNYQGGGHLAHSARITIHMMHRIGALITFFYLGGLSLWMISACKSRALFRLAQMTLLVLIIQVTLGILNVVLQLPLHVAVAHNGVAALLLLCLVGLNYSLFTHQPKRITCCRP